jgi:pimeloyl-ACP methyl ester carboxylesterase
MSVKTEKSADATAIRPFTIDTPEADLDDLRARIAATRWPEKETVEDQSQGPRLATMQALARYWADEYDWRECEEKLKALPHFITEIDGLDIHFIHVRSEHDDALPLIVLHGWPGSVIEQLKIIDPLTNPTANGASAADAFHLVIPSMPGYGFSGKPTETGWGPEHIARAYAELMKRLGYDRYVAQGGDWGAEIVEVMGVQAPPGLLGIHTNFPGAVRPDVSAGVQSGVAPSGLDDEETRIYENLKSFFATDAGYAIESATHPQALYGIADSPIGLAAWMLDHDATSMEHISRVFDGDQHGFGLTRDDVLDNITHYWLTNTGVSAARLYWEDRVGFFDPKAWPTADARAIVDIPVAVSVFPEEIYAPPRSWAEEAYPKLIHYNKLDKGGHFAAWEQPELLSEEVRTGFRKLR